MKSFSSHHNHNTSGHSLRKFRNMKYFQDQKGYETDYMKKKNDGQGNTPSNKKCMNKFDEQVNEYFRKTGSDCYKQSMFADEDNKLDYASEVESKIKILETKHLASSQVFKQLSHCHSDLMNLHNVQSLTNQSDLKIVNKSLENSHRQISERQFKSSSNLTITNTPYKSPSFQNKKSTKSMQIHSNPYCFNQSNIGDVQKILESSLDNFDEEEIAENSNVRQKILDSLNELNAEEDNFINLDGTDEQEEVYYINGKILQKQFNNKSNIINQNLSDSCDLFMQNIDESENYSVNQKFQLSQSNIKPINHQNSENNYYMPQKSRKETTDKKRNHNESHSHLSINQNQLYYNNTLNQTQQYSNASPINYNRFLSPDTTQKKPAMQTAQINFHHNNKNQIKEKTYDNQVQTKQSTKNNIKVKNVVQQYEDQQKSQSLNKNQQSQQQTKKQMPTTQRDNRQNSVQKQNRDNSRSASQSRQNSENKRRRNSISMQNNRQSSGSKLNKSPIQNKINTQDNLSSSKNIEKYYLQQVERQNDIVSQQQKQILQYQQQFQKQTMEFQLFMQEQQLLKQQQYFQQQQQIMQQQRLSAQNNLFFQNQHSPALSTSFSPNFQTHLLLQNQLAGSQQFIPSLLIPGQQQSQAGTAQFIPQISPPIIINNNIQKKDFEKEINTQQVNQNISKNSQQNLNPSSKTIKNHALNSQSPFKIGNCDKNTDETLILNVAQQASGDISHQTEQLLKCNNDSSLCTINGNTQKRQSSQRRRWDIGQKTCPQSELSGDESYLTSANREIKQPKQFQLNPQLQINVQPQQQTQQIKHILKKPVRFEIFWEKEELDQENKENRQNNSNKCNINESKQESIIQKQYKSAIDQAENSSSVSGQQKNLQDTFVSKKTEQLKRLDNEKNAQNNVVLNRNQSPEISKEDLIQIRKDLLKPKSQQVMQLINYDSNSNNNRTSSQNQTTVQENPKQIPIQQDSYKLNPTVNQCNLAQIQSNTTQQQQYNFPYQQSQLSESYKDTLQKQHQQPQQQYQQSQQLQLNRQQQPQPLYYPQSQQYTQQSQQFKPCASSQQYPLPEQQSKYDTNLQSQQYNYIQQHTSQPQQQLQLQPPKQLTEQQTSSKYLIDLNQQQTQQQNSFSLTPSSYSTNQKQQQQIQIPSYLNLPSQLNDKFYKTINVQTPNSQQQDKQQTFDYLNNNSISHQSGLSTNSNLTPVAMNQNLYNLKFPSPSINGMDSNLFSDQNDSNYKLQKGFTSQIEQVNPLNLFYE